METISFIKITKTADEGSTFTIVGDFYLLIEGIHGNGRLNIEERSTIAIIVPRSNINILKIMEDMLTFST